jgi:formate hydrogenlyase subunit 3/multisubunit Na+/H+ antiporter MnhD subunit
MNRTGDMILSIGFFALFGLFGSLNYETIFALAPHANEVAITIIALLLIGGSLAKSAQIPLHSWLPGSMEAPTPVSALLHAANEIFKFKTAIRHYCCAGTLRGQRLLHHIIKFHILYFCSFICLYLSVESAFRGTNNLACADDVGRRIHKDPKYF